MTRGKESRHDQIFIATRREFNRAFRRIIQQQQVDWVLAEAALPAYAHPNPLINQIMWRRLKVVYDYLNQFPGSRILDFGCGSGVAACLLARAGHQITMYDPELKPLRYLQAKISFPATVKLQSLTFLQMPDSAQVFDFIIALDVLEHINQISEQLVLFRRLLTDRGELIVSGPTENLLYQIGRRLAGRQFSGDYHTSDIRKIKKFLGQSGRLHSLATIYPILPLFEIFAVNLQVKK